MTTQISNIWTGFNPSIENADEYIWNFTLNKRVWEDGVSIGFSHKSIDKGINYISDTTYKKEISIDYLFINGQAGTVPQDSIQINYDGMSFPISNFPKGYSAMECMLSIKIKLTKIKDEIIIPPITNESDIYLTVQIPIAYKDAIPKIQLLETKIQELPLNVYGYSFQEISYDIQNDALNKTYFTIKFKKHGSIALIMLLAICLTVIVLAFAGVKIFASIQDMKTNENYVGNITKYEEFLKYIQDLVNEGVITQETANKMIQDASNIYSSSNGDLNNDSTTDKIISIGTLVLVGMIAYFMFRNN